MKKIVVIVTMLLLVVLTSAQLGDFGNYVKAEEVRIKQVCDDATYINISSITYPNSTTAVSNIEMTSSGSGEYFYNFNDTGAIGRYYVNGISDGCDKVFAFYFEVTNLGEEFTSPIAFTYGSSLFLLFLLILGTLFIISRLPNNDHMDEQNQIIQVSQLKHFRMVGWVIVYGLTLAMVFIMSNFTLAYLKDEFLGGIFFNVYTVMFWGMIIILPFTFIWLLWTAYKSNEMQKIINRGGDFTGNSF